MPLKILIAEDSATNRLLFSMTMKRLGHAADIAVNGMEACQLFRGTHYDLVFLDLNMPVADGIRAAMEINKNNPRGVPVYAISGFPSPEMERKFPEAGIRACLIKPLDKEKLEKVIAESGLSRKAQAAVEEAAFTLGRVPKTLVRTYAAELRSRGHACEALARQNDSRALYRECHTIRSLAQMLGMHELEERAAVMEKRAAELQPLDADAEVHNFMEACCLMADMVEKKVMSEKIIGDSAIA